jgi:hypothetical protein
VEYASDLLKLEWEELGLILHAMSLIKIGWNHDSSNKGEVLVKWGIVLELNNDSHESEREITRERREMEGVWNFLCVN